jgi:predicted alpha/beta hydrolase family esterase
MVKKKTQILVIHGGTTFRNKEDYLDFLTKRDISIDKKTSWRKDYLEKELGEDCEVITPRMPLQDNAEYEEWKIHFERHFDLLNDELILIGVSLGGIFLAKYLSENNFPKKIISAYLVAPPFDNSLGGEDLLGGFELGDDLSLIENNCKNVTLLFSKDDDSVPVLHMEKYKEKLPNCKTIVYESKNGHFKIEEFPEIVAMIKEMIK